MIKLRKFSSGFTLVELMIGLVLSSVIVLAITSIFLSNSESYRINTAQTQIQEAGRIALELMSQDIRMSGTWACSGNSLVPEDLSVDITTESLAIGSLRNTLRPTNNTVAAYYQQYQVPIMVHQFVSPNWTSNANLNQIIAGLVVDTNSDIITIRRGSSNTFEITSNTYNANSSGANVSFQSNAGESDLDWNKPLFLVGAQCNYAAVVNVSRDGTTGEISLNNDVIPGPNYESGYLGQAISNTYFIAQSGINPDVNSLWISSNGGSVGQIAEELVTGVQAMRIHLGTGNNSVEQYVRANAIGANDWEEVKAIRIQLITLGEPTNIADAAQSFTLINHGANNTNINIPENRIGQSFTSTITIRNRVR